MMPRVMVVMSTYNGKDNLIRQMDSIFNQKDVEVFCYARDDGSTDGTQEVLKNYSSKNKNLIVEFGENIGCARSFLEALKHCGDDADYYAFSDQDDYWLENKLIRCVQEFDNNSTLPQLVHCNLLRTDVNLKPLSVKQSSIIERPSSYKNAMTQMYLRGCAGVFNREARNLINRAYPDNFYGFYHDAWCGMVCAFFGDVRFVDEPLFYYVSHGNNVSVAGDDKKLKLHRIKQVLKPHAYANFSKCLLDNYADVLSDKHKVFLHTVVNYRFCIKDRMRLLFDSEFKRKSILSTFILRTHILIGWF